MLLLNRFQIAFEESDGFADLETGNIRSNNRVGAPHCRHGLPLTVPTTTMEETEISEPVLVDMVLTGANALLRCVVFDAFCTTRSLEHLHSSNNSVAHAVSDSATTPLKGGGKWRNGSKSRKKEGFSEIPRDSYHEVFFSESSIISPNALFTRMEYKIDDKAPYPILYLKLWRLGGHPQSNTVEYRTKRYSDLYPTHRLEPGCFIITNIAITDCIDTLRLCWAPTAKGLMKAMEYYTIFDSDDAAESAMQSDTVTPLYRTPSTIVVPTRRTSLLSHQTHGSYQSV